MKEIILVIIILLESSGNPLAYHKSTQAIGLCQITPICLEDYNQLNKNEKLTRRDLWNPRLNKKVATWYLYERIPQMLKRYNKPVNMDNILICYNAGIKYVVKNLPLPKETKNYIKQYKKEIKRLGRTGNLDILKSL